MAIYYVDVEGGNDSFDGTNFSNRKKTLASATASLVAGDTIRVMKSPDPTLVGNATWTNGGKTVVLAAPVTANIDMCESGWVGGNANVTMSYTVANSREGTNGLGTAVLTAFTTGIVAYKNLGTALDLSAYEQISFWMRQTVGTVLAAGDMTIRLCSDTAGTVVLDSFSVPALGALTVWHPIVIRKSSPPMSAGVQSISIVLNFDRGAQSFNFDNFIACKAPTAADSLTLRSLISKSDGTGTGTEAFAPIKSINGSTVTLSCANANDSSDSLGPYSGTTETVATYKREPVRPTLLPASATDVNFGSLNTSSGTLASPITLSGGWDTTNMTTQTGETYIDGVNGNGYGLSSSSNYWNVSKLNFARWNIGVNLNSANCTFNIRDIVGCSTIGFNASPGTGVSSAYNTINITNASYNGSAATHVGYQSTAALENTVTITNANSNYGMGYSIIGSSAMVIGENATVTNALNNGTANVRILSSSSGTFTLGNISSSIAGTYPLQLGNTLFITPGYVGVPPLFNTIKIASPITSTAYAISVGPGTGNVLDVTGITFNTLSATAGMSGLTVKGGSSFSVNGVNGSMNFIGSSPISTNLTDNTTPGSTSSFAFQDIGSVGVHRIANNRGQFDTDTTTRHTASGVSWKYSPKSGGTTPTAKYASELPLAKVAVNASSLVTATVWVYRSNLTPIARLVCKGGQIAGVTSDVIATASGAINTWEQLSISFTPSASGVVEIVGQCYGSSSVTQNTWFDDFDVGQA